MAQIEDEGYEGIKFDVVQTGSGVSLPCRNQLATFVACGKRLASYELTPGASGNLSIKVPEGMVITTSGSDLSDLRLKDLSLVTHCDETTGQAHYSSDVLPSSESFLHWRILTQNHAVRGIVHVHGDLGLPKRLGVVLPETPREAPYGSTALSQMAAQTVKFGPHGSVIVLKNHGFLALGANLFEATDLLVSLKIQSDA